jgi:transposase InsO family protein
LKIEMFFARDWLSTTIEEFVAELDAYIGWYNDTRIKSSLGLRSPAEHRRSLGIAA